MVPTNATMVTLIVIASVSEAAGVLPIKKSLKVTPPIEVKKAIISTPKMSRFFLMAEEVPDTAKEKMSSISTI